MVLYNLTNITNAGNMGDIFIAINSESKLILGAVILGMIFFTMFLSMKFRGYATKDAFAVASFLNIALCLLLYPMGMIGGKELLISVVLVAGSVAGLFYNPGI